MYTEDRLSLGEIEFEEGEQKLGRNAFRDLVQLFQRLFARPKDISGVVKQVHSVRFFTGMAES